MKKILTFLLVMLVVLTGCSSSQSNGGDNTTPTPTPNKTPEVTPEETIDTKEFYIPGTYTATVDGHNDKITVEVTVDEHNILSVVVIEHAETKDIADDAIIEIPLAIVEMNGIKEIDLITGATVTSKAIIQAVSDALDQATAK